MSVLPSASHGTPALPRRRRDALRLLGTLGLLGMAGTARRATASLADEKPASLVREITPGSCVITAQETEGPYPLLAILGNSAIVRQDITERKAGVPLTLNLRLENMNRLCEPIKGAAVYIWHCDKDGLYSGYPDQTGDIDTTGQSFLRGVQRSDEHGQVTFTTIYPGWYEGRITHIHVQVYLNNKLMLTAVATTQLAFPQSITKAVYNSALYQARGQNTSIADFSEDMVFSDGTATEMLVVSGDITTGYQAAMTLGVVTA